MTWSHKSNSLLLTKSSLFQLRKDGGVRPVGHLTVAALHSYWSQVRPTNDDIPELVCILISVRPDKPKDPVDFRSHAPFSNERNITLFMCKTFAEIFFINPNNSGIY